MKQHAEALGDIQSWHQLQSLSYLLAIKEPEYELIGVYRVTRDGKMRIDIFSEGTHVFSEAFNGTYAWQWHPGLDQALVIEGDKAAALRHGVELPGHLNTLLDMRSRGHELEYLTPESNVGGEPHQLKLTLSDGHIRYYRLDAQTGLILSSQDRRAFHPDIDQSKVQIETRWEEYRQIAGFYKSFRTINWDVTNDRWLGTTDVLTLIPNEAIDSKYFNGETLTALPPSSLQHESREHSSR